MDLVEDDADHRGVTPTRPARCHDNVRRQPSHVLIDVAIALVEMP